MKVLHIGPKNYPPNHGGVEKSVYDIIKYSEDFKIDSYIFVEWGGNNSSNKNIQILPKGLVNQLKVILKFVNEKKLS